MTSNLCVRKRNKPLVGEKKAQQVNSQLKIRASSDNMNMEAILSIFRADPRNADSRAPAAAALSSPHYTAAIYHLRVCSSNESSNYSSKLLLHQYARTTPCILDFKASIFIEMKEMAKSNPYFLHKLFFISLFAPTMSNQQGTNLRNIDLTYQ